MNTFRGVVKDVTYPNPLKLVKLTDEIEGVHITTVDYQKSIVNDEVSALFFDEVAPDL